MGDRVNLPQITIFTPTYNRAKELGRLYRSLLSQSDLRFEWVIVDDGSTDDTDALVSEWIAAKPPFSIRLFRQENSGKHVAHNLGAKESKCPLFMCVDSDDWLASDAVETILGVALRENEVGVVFPRLLIEDGKPLETPWFPQGVERIELSDMRMKYGLVIETAIVFRTETLRKHPFPVIEGERFMPEGSAYYEFHKPEVFLVNPSKFYRCSYLEDGLTNNIYRNWLANPVGVTLSLEKRYRVAMKYSGIRSIRERLAAVAGIESLNMALGNPPWTKLSCRLIDGICALPLAVLLMRNRYKRLG